jgi:thiol-disulfide isomerase/thioredoxin
VTTASRPRLRESLGRALPWVAVAGLVLVAVGQLRARGGIDEGVSAPSFDATLDDGTTFRPEAYRDRVVVLNFWGSHCPPCRREAPALARVAAELRARGDVLVGLSVDPTPLAEAVRAGRAFGMNYSLALAPEAALDAYRVRVLPTTVIIAPGGRVARTIVGEVDEARLRAEVAAARGLLSSPPR